MNDAFSSLPADQLLNNLVRWVQIPDVPKADCKAYNVLIRSARSGQSSPAPPLPSVPLPTQSPTNLHFSAPSGPASPLQNQQQGILKPGLLGHNQGLKPGGPFNHGLNHNHSPQGLHNLGPNVPGSINLGHNRGLNPPGPPNNHNQALGPFPGPHNQERRGGNRVRYFPHLVVKTLSKLFIL